MAYGESGALLGYAEISFKNKVRRVIGVDFMCFEKMCY